MPISPSVPSGKKPVAHASHSCESRSNLTMVVGVVADMGSRHEAAKLEVGPDWKWSMIREHDIVVLTKDLPEEDLAAGDAGTVVHVHPDNAGYEVEFMTLGGQTIAVITALPHQLRCITRRDIVHVRELAVA